MTIQRRCAKARPRRTSGDPVENDAHVRRGVNPDLIINSDAGRPAWWRRPRIDPIARWDRASVRRRALAVILTIMIEALLVWGLLSLARDPVGKSEKATSLIAFQLAPAAKQAAAASRKPVTKKAEKMVPNPVVTRPKPVVLPTANKGFVEMSREDLAAGDIAKLPPARSAAQEGGGGAGDSALASGQGPGGEPLYRAEWFREPREGELALYMPKSRPQRSWALIACRTIEHYHVENCQALGESPPGSGLARGMRQAAWQFLVRPPRVGNKPLVGAWVSIRFDFTTVSEK